MTVTDEVHLTPLVVPEVKAQQSSTPTSSPNQDLMCTSGPDLGHTQIAPETEDARVPPSASEYPIGARFWLITFSLAGVLILGGLDSNIISTAVPRITDDFHTVSDVAWYSSAYRLSASFQFMFGKMYKLFHIKPIFLIANVIFLAGSLLCALATSSAMLVVGRAITGLGWAGILGGCFTILVYILPLHKRPMYTGVLSGIESLAVIAAPSIGGVLTESLGWRWCFWINLPIGGICLVLATFSLPKFKLTDDAMGWTMKQKIRELDLVSNALLIPSLTCLFIALSWAGTKYAWSNAKVIGLLVSFGVLFVAFFVNQRRRGDSAALPFRILKRRSVIAGFIFAVCNNGATNVLQYYLPTYYQVVRGYSPAKSGYMMIPIIVGGAIGMLSCGAGTSILGYFTPFMLCASILMPIFAGLITTFELHTSLVRIILYSVASGFSLGIGFQAPQTAVQAILPMEDVALGLSIMLFAQSFGPAIFVSVAQVIFTNRLLKDLDVLLPQLNATTIIDNGLTGIVSSVPTTEKADVLRGINNSVTQTWYLVVALSCATMIGSLLMEWRSVKEKKT